MSLSEHLKAAGLSTTQAKLYAASVHRGRARRAALQHDAGCKKTAAVRNLKALASLGLVTFSWKDGVRFVTARPPTRVVGLLQQRQRQLARAVQALRALRVRR